MNIAVCVNFVPDTAAKLKIVNNEIDKSGITYIINPYDEFAVEEAIKTKEKLGGEVTVLSVGGDNNKEAIRKALAMGADNGTLLKIDGYYDSFVVASALANEIKELNADIVFCGKQSIDYDNSITPQLTAEILSYNCVSVVTKLEIENNKVIAEKEVEGGKEIIETTLPVVISAQKGLNEPRFASLKGIMAAKKKEIKEKSVGVFEPLVQTGTLSTPPPKPSGKILGSDVNAVHELVKLLREEAKVI